MFETTIIGSGFSALTAYMLLKKYNPKILALSNIKLLKKLLINRKNLQTNKLFSKKSLSLGDLNYTFKSNIKLHDRLELGGNSNIWGGFININNISKQFIKICNEYSITLEELNLKKNGYTSNYNSIRQLRDSNNNILNTNFFFTDFIDGYAHSFEIHNNYILLKYLNGKNNNIEFIKTKKLILALSLPQLIDLLFRSGYLQTSKIFSLNEFNHKFIFSLDKTINDFNNNDCIIKYDFLRTLKHYFGYQNSLDNYKIPLPFYINQIFSAEQNFLELKLNLDKKNFDVYNFSKEFGSSIHYCNLFIDKVHIDEFLSKISTNIIGVGMPFVKQNRPGPISNDIVNNLLDKV